MFSKKILIKSIMLFYGTVHGKSLQVFRHFRQGQKYANEINLKVFMHTNRNFVRGIRFAVLMLRHNRSVFCEAHVSMLNSINYKNELNIVLLSFEKRRNIYVVSALNLNNYQLTVMYTTTG